MASAERTQVEESLKSEFLHFLERYTSDGHQDSQDSSQAQGPTFDYVEQVNDMKNRDAYTLFVDFAHLIDFDQGSAQVIEENYYRFEGLLREVVKTFVRKYHPDYVKEQNGKEKDFWISFFNMSYNSKVRDLKTDKHGKLISIVGTVTRTSEVRPELLYGSFTCVECGEDMGKVEQQFKFCEPVMCKNNSCSNRNKWDLKVRDSTFVDWQRVRLQENSSEIPAGSMPRTVDVILRNEQVENAKAGDKCIFTGCLIMVPDISQMRTRGEKAEVVSRGAGRMPGGEGVTGLKALGTKDLTYKMAFLASSVIPAEQRFGTVNIREEDEEDPMSQFTVAEKDELQWMRSQQGIYQRLTDSICPSVFGHSEIKRGILLMLFGGVHKQSKEDKTKLRGDINVCLVGDPSTAKSHFLKYVCNILPRAIYTSGKASSAAGLTATVSKDEETGEFCIEAGALMLADNGICCIDEFDKMDPKDQVAIHEAMEQQTISIAKAGIAATLNARASVLAAANPIGGRYDRSKTLKQNLNITPAIMSRFDLFFVVLDDCDEVNDYNIARHIVDVHRNKESAHSIRADFTIQQVQRYIKYARTIKPKLTPEASKLLVSHYRELRQGDGGSNKTAYRITVRQLEAMIRLGEALARVHCSDKVEPKHIKEAARLLKGSIVNVENPDVEMETGEEEEELMAQDDVEVEQETESRKVEVSYERYKQITNLVLTHLSKKGEAMREGDLIEWHLNEQDIQTELGLETERKLMRAVIHTMLVKEKSLMNVSEAAVESVDDRLLAVHPNHENGGGFSAADTPQQEEATVA